MERFLVARILLTIATAGYGLVTIRADFNKTHATNPKWTGHARFHVVWQITSYAGFGLIALGLIWLPGSLARERLYLAAGFAAVVYGAFMVTLAAMPLYGGRAYDDNGYRPIAVAGRKLDANVAVFSVMTVVLLLAVALTATG